MSFLPTIIRLNPTILGYELYTSNIQEKFLPYILYFVVGVYVKKQFKLWEVEMSIEQKNDIKSDNSEMMEFFADKKKNINWQNEYLKIRFSSAYFVFKIRRLWFFFDKISSILFVIISLIIMFLSNYW